MRRALILKNREALFSVLPVTAIIFLMSFTPLISLSGAEYLVFASSSVMLIFGIGLFNLGADLAMTPMGEYVGEGLTKSRRTFVLLMVSLLMGILITVAEPDLSVLAEQVSTVMSSGLLILSVGTGVGLFLLLAVLKIVMKRDIREYLLFFYMFLFMLTAILLEQEKKSFLPMAFDSGGVTTGPITVPFIMALGIGISQTVGGRKSNENSFGIVALCSIGPILAVCMLCLFTKGELNYPVPDYSVEANLGEKLGKLVLSTALEVARSLALILAFFAILQVTVLRLPKKRLMQILIGVTYTFFGLVIFLSAVTTGFMPVGYRIGVQLAAAGGIPVALFGFGIGMVVVLAEPAVRVLNLQVEEITEGEVSRLQMMIAMSAGVGVSICLSFIRILAGFSVLYYLVPGYLLSLGLSFFVPPLYTAIAFDSGGVASGPLTSGFILPLAIGVCVAARGSEAVLDSAFGIVAMVAMTPLITIQSLGFKGVVQRHMRNERSMKHILAADDAQIIYFR